MFFSVYWRMSLSSDKISDHILQPNFLDREFLETHTAFLMGYVIDVGSDGMLPHLSQVTCTLSPWLSQVRSSHLFPDACG